MLRRTLFFLLWWVSLVSSRYLVGAASNKDTTLSVDAFDDDAYTYVDNNILPVTNITDINLGEFRLDIRPTTSILNCEAITGLLQHVEVKMVNYLETTTGLSDVSVEISIPYQQKIRGDVVAIQRTGCGVRRLTQDSYKENINIKRGLDQYTQTAELDIIGVTIQHRTQQQNPSARILMDMLQEAVHSNNGNITIADDFYINEIILLWKNQNYTLEPATSLELINSDRDEQPTDVPSWVPSGEPSKEGQRNSLLGDGDTTLSTPEQPQTTDTSTELIYDSLTYTFIGLGAVALFSGVFYIKRRRRPHDNDEEDYTTPKLQGETFLPGMNFDYDVNGDEIEVSPRNTNPVDLSAIEIHGNHSISMMSDVSDEFVITDEDIEHTWTNSAPKRQYIMDDDQMNQIRNSASNRNPHPYSDVSSSNLYYSTTTSNQSNTSNQSLTYFSATTSEDDRSSRSAVDSYRTCDANDNETESHDNRKESIGQLI